MHLENVDFVKHKEKIVDVIDMLMCSTKEHDHKLYHHIKSEIYEMEHGKTITPELAEKWVNSMEPHGQRFSMQEVVNHLRAHGIELDHTAAYVVVNMMANDFSDVVSTNLDLAARLAKDWLNDTDAVENKLYCYYKHIVK